MLKLVEIFVLCEYFIFLEEMRKKLFWMSANELFDLYMSINLNKFKEKYSVEELYIFVLVLMFFVGVKVFRCCISGLYCVNEVDILTTFTFAYVGLFFMWVNVSDDFEVFWFELWYLIKIVLMLLVVIWVELNCVYMKFESRTLAMFVVVKIRVCFNLYLISIELLLVEVEYVLFVSGVLSCMWSVLILILNVKGVMTESGVAIRSVIGWLFGSLYIDWMIVEIDFIILMFNLVLIIGIFNLMNSDVLFVSCFRRYVFVLFVLRLFFILVK